MRLAAKLVREWQRRLGLTDWHVEVVDAHAALLGLDTQAQCRINRARKVAYLCFQGDDTDLLDSVVHELLHIVFDPADEVVETLLAASQLGAVGEALIESYRLHREQALAQIARAVVGD